MRIQRGRYDPARSGPNSGGGTRRLDAASYADAILKIRCSAPGSALNTSENGNPGAGTGFGVSLAVATYRFLSGLRTNVAS